MNKYFPKNSYDTAEDTKRFFIDKIFLNTRWGFFIKYFGILKSCRKLAFTNQYDRSNWAKSSYDVFQIIEGCGGKFHISGLENIKDLKEPVVYISNHMSTLETMIFPSIIAPIQECTFVVKESLTTHPFFGPIMRARNPIAVARENPREDFKVVMEEGQKKLAGGTSVIIFPQSTRTADINPKTFNSLGVKLAIKAGVKVVPVAIKTDFWGNGKVVKDIGKIDRTKPIYMKFGKPMEVKAPGKKENAEIIDYIVGNLKEWRD